MLRRYRLHPQYVADQRCVHGADMHELGRRRAEQKQRVAQWVVLEYRARLGPAVENVDVLEQRESVVVN